MVSGQMPLMRRSSPFYNYKINKSGRSLPPYKYKDIHSYESELSRADLFVFTD